MQNSYLALNGPHPLLKGLDGTPRIVHGVARVATKPHDTQAQSPLLFIPSYPDLPMEEVYPRAGQKPTQTRSVRETVGQRPSRLLPVRS